MATNVTMSTLLKDVDKILMKHLATNMAHCLAGLHILAPSPPDNVFRELHLVTVHADPTYGAFPRLATLRAGSNPGLVEVHGAGQWVALSTWLQNLQITDKRATGEKGYEQQWQFWACNVGKFFPFSDLPGELMQPIIEAALHPRVAPSLQTGSSNPNYLFGDGIFFDDMRDDPDTHLEYKPNRALLEVSSELREACFESVWKYSRQVFQASSDFDSFRASQDLIRYETLSKVCLDFEMVDWASKLGLPLNNEFSARRMNFVAGTPNRSETLKQLMPQLQDLQLHFRSPKHTSPPVPHEPQVDDNGAVTADTVTGDFLLTVLPCQKHVVNAILVYAWPWIKDVDTIRLTGCIKDSTKALWMHRHHRFHYARQDADLSLAKSSVDQMISAGLTGSPVACQCTTPCMFARPADRATDAEILAHFKAYVWNPSD